jgi:hypothetical protein
VRESQETIDWIRLDSESVRPLLGQKLLALRGDGKMYTGLVVDIDRDNVTLASGNTRQILQLGNYRYMGAVYQGPEPWTPKLAERRLV